MNRIIIIGNGFDLAHSLKTGYRDFIDDYWESVTEEVFGRYKQYLKNNWHVMQEFSNYEDEFVVLYKTYDKTGISKNSIICKDSPFGKLCALIEEYNKSPGTTVSGDLKFKNLFFERISKQCSLVNWVDIENEYYIAVKELLLEENLQIQRENICTLNKEFDGVKRLLEDYLTKVTKNTEVNVLPSIQEAFSSSIEFKEIATCKQTMYVDSIFTDKDMCSDPENEKERNRLYLQYILRLEDSKQKILIENKANKEYLKKDHPVPKTLVLNFNYTKTAEKLYVKNDNDKIINIHGELNNENNPIIFGYGDELDDSYSKIEGLQNNDFLENIKSIKYHQTRNYRDLLMFIASGPYQIFIMGHSCGNSDRTLLNTLFEHSNCLSIKVFYYQFKKNLDSIEKYSDNYSDIIKNISRNFNNKPNMRDILVNKEDSSPLVPVKREVAE